MSAIDRNLNQSVPINADLLRERKARTARVDILFAMRHPDELVIETTYTDAKGNRTRRVMSPIRLETSKKFLALCLCRQQPQTFLFEKCSDVELKLASDYVMPVPIMELK